MTQGNQNQLTFGGLKRGKKFTVLPPQKIIAFCGELQDGTVFIKMGDGDSDNALTLYESVPCHVPKDVSVCEVA